MKTSNKLMLSALIILLISLTIFNSSLIAEYRTGNYKDPFKGYKSINIKNFNEIQVDAINMMHIMVREGDYAIHLSESNDDSIRFTKVGNRLIISVDFDKNPESNNPNIPHWGDVIIYCPKLSYVKTDDHHYTMPLKKWMHRIGNILMTPAEQ